MTPPTARRPAPTCDVFAKDERRIRSVAAGTVDAGTAAAVATSFKLLSSPTRVRIVDALARSELCVCDLAVLLDTRISALSHQLALLKQHRIVKNRREGKMVFYSLDDRHVQSLFRQALAHTRHSRKSGQDGRVRAGRRNQSAGPGTSGRMRT